MSLLANHPTFSYVSATGITIIHNEEMHVVHDFNTNKMFIWWDESVPNIFQASNVRPDAKTGRYLVIVNENGTPMVVPHSEIQLFFDGNSLANVTDRIYGLYEKNEEDGERFLAIEQDVTGVKVTVGQLQEEDNSIKQNISKIEQRADEIDLSVKSVTKSFNDDKEIRELRESLNGAIIKLNADIGLFKSNWNDYIKDDAITSLESTEIKAHLSAIQLSLTALYVPVNTVLTYARNNGMTSDVTKLNSAISALDTAHRNLVDGTNTVIADGIITPSDRTVMINAFSRYNLRIDELKNVCDDVILLGMGGNVIEQFAYINIQADKIENKVAVVENGVETNASTITQTATQIRAEVKAVETDLDGKISLANSTITQTATQIRAEVKAVETALDGKISTTNSTITQTATQIRAEVKAVETTLDGKISTTNSTITQTASQIRAEVKSTTDGLQSSITQNANQIALKVNTDGVISAINLASGSATISAAKVNLTGYATFSALNQNGLTTTIHGGNITTNTITADHVNAKHFYGISITTTSNTTQDRAVLTGDGINFYSAGTLNSHAGKLSYDSNGAGTTDNSRNRLWLRSLSDYALKIQSSGDMSIEANGGYTNIWMLGNKVAINTGTGGFWINNTRFDPANFTATAVFGS